MATNLIYLGDPRENREREVGENVLPGTLVIVDGRPAVTLTASGGTPQPNSYTTPTGFTVSGGPSIGGVGNREDYATVAFNGTWEFAVAGATVNTANGVPVFRASNGNLTLTATDNTRIGVTDYPPDYAKVAGKAPVRIGG